MRTPDVRTVRGAARVPASGASGWRVRRVPSTSNAVRIGRLFVTACAWMTLAGPVASAANDTPSGTPQAARRTAHASAASIAYVFVPGDQLEITVQPQEGYDRVVTVQPDGKIVFPVVGEVTAAGLTVQELTERLQRGLQAQLKRPHVTISLKEMNKGLLRRASVLGAVKTPGSYELRERSTVFELLATAGGPTAVADLRRVTIARADGSRNVVVDLSRAGAGADPGVGRPTSARPLDTRAGEGTVDAVLEPGDLIIVPEGLPRTVLVLGEVARPGSYELQGEMRLLDALSLAGGPTPKADLRRVTLTRGGQAAGQTVDLESLLTRGQQADLTANVVLEPGDTIVLPDSERKFYVLGDVNRPEAYPLRPGDRLLDAITRAGGGSREADLAKVQLLRNDETGRPVARRVDLRRMMRKGEMTQNHLLREGDIIFVPGRKETRNLWDRLSVLYPLSGILSFLRY